MRKSFLILLLIPALSLRGNDGVFYATGNTLVPLKENIVRLKKEILNLTRKNDWMQVDIYFEFFNPGPERELTVGFVTPPAMGDVGDEEAKHPFIRDFMVMEEDRLLTFKVAKMSETGFQVSSKIAEGYDFVYYFTVRFAKGITVIRHSYLYKGGSSVEARQDFDYRLTTGTTWANSAIDDFELNIDMGDDTYFSVPAAFGNQAVSWQMAGIGRLSRTAFSIPYFAEGKKALRMVYLRKGKLQLRALAFKPTADLSINCWQLHNEVSLWCEKNAKNDFEGIMDLVWGDSTETGLQKLSDESLRMYRNLNYARYGYDFKDENLKRAFSKYIWYIPQPGLNAAEAPDYYISPDLMQRILAEEKKRKSK